MSEVICTAKKWGSSLGVVIPKAIVDERHIKENDKVIVEIKNRLLVKDLFGKFPRIKGGKTAQQIKDDMRKGWD
ncbi:MAG TPA: AbrB/MazE/SpoVT family DNA-binding domain-containing protein [Candidatus Nanoarchaeia archaeon]|nr:AbrB/MazE/SpoVT family DNA-binding domain-containing protein [Candidatus Nanoarchaeia archaeon]